MLLGLDREHLVEAPPMPRRAAERRADEREGGIVRWL
jgi:hypothetical protein